MRKKWVFLRMERTTSVPEEHQALIRADNDDFYIMTVRSPEEAVEKARQLKEEGFGNIECCGAFGEELARKMFEATGCTVPVSYMHTPEDEVELARKFWMS